MENNLKVKKGSYFENKHNYPPKQRLGYVQRRRQGVILQKV